MHKPGEKKAGNDAHDQGFPEHFFGGLGIGLGSLGIHVRQEGGEDSEGDSKGVRILEETQHLWRVML